MIIRHHVDYLPDRVSTTSSIVLNRAAGPLTAASNNGDWYYDNTTNEFTYIGKHALFLVLLHGSVRLISCSEKSIVELRPS